MRMPAHHRLPLLPFLDVSELRDTGINKMNGLTAKGLADRTRIGVMSIGRHPLWSVAYHISGLLEKALGCLHISLLTHHRVNQVPIPIDGPIEITPFPFDVDVDAIPNVVERCTTRRC